MEKWDILYNTIEQCANYRSNLWHPWFVQATSYFYHNIITAGEWIRWIALINSDNIALGNCTLNHIPGVSI